MKLLDTFDGAENRFQIGVKSAAQYQPLPTGRQAEHIPSFHRGIEGLINSLISSTLGTFPLTFTTPSTTSAGVDITP